jgi:beta-glucosidase
VAVVGSAEFRAAGHRAQAESVTVVVAGQEGAPVLPIPPGGKVFVEGVDPVVAGEYAQVVDDPAAADLAIVRLTAPFEPRDHYFLESAFHQGSLEFPAEVVDRIRGLAAHVPVVLDVFIDRPAILTPLLPLARALVVDFGASDRALLDALTGRIAPRGRLPFDLPRSTAAVLAARSDVAGDTADPLWRIGDGISIV